MKFRVETTIPQRQFENLKTSYECEMSERDTAINMAIEDCKRYNNIINKETPKELQDLIYKAKEGETFTASGIKYTFTNGKWSFERLV